MHILKKIKFINKDIILKGNVRKKGDFSITQYEDTFQATLTDVIMREVILTDDSTIEIADGEKWCIESLNISTSIIKYPCDYLGLQISQKACYDNKIVTCLDNVIVLEEACEEGQKCTEVVGGYAVCE